MVGHANNKGSTWRESRLGMNGGAYDGTPVDRGLLPFAEIKDVGDTEMWHSLYNNVNNSDWGAGTMYIFNPFSSDYTFMINQTFIYLYGIKIPAMIKNYPFKVFISSCILFITEDE